MSYFVTMMNCEWKVTKLFLYKTYSDILTNKKAQIVDTFHVNKYHNPTGPFLCVLTGKVPQTTASSLLKKA